MYQLVLHAPGSQLSLSNIFPIAREKVILDVLSGPSLPRHMLVGIFRCLARLTHDQPLLQLGHSRIGIQDGPVGTEDGLQRGVRQELDLESGLQRVPHVVELDDLPPAVENEGTTPKGHDVMRRLVVDDRGHVLAKFRPLLLLGFFTEPVSALDGQFCHPLLHLVHEDLPFASVPAPAAVPPLGGVFALIVIDAHIDPCCVNERDALSGGRTELDAAMIQTLLQKRENGHTAAVPAVDALDIITGDVGIGDGRRK